MPKPMDSMMSKGAGAAHAVKSRLEGLSGVFITLSKQHAEARVLMERLQKNPEKRDELWPEIRRSLVSHERGELRAVMPVLGTYPQLRTIVDKHDSEAQELEALINQIDVAADWRPLFDTLVTTVIAHAEDEEKNFFPLALEVIGKSTAKDLDDRFLEVQKSVKQVV